MVSILTNIANLEVQNCLADANNRIETSLKRMSTGFRINNAADDVAGFSTASAMESQLSSLSVVQDNIAQSISLLNIAEGALSNIQSLLLRMRDLSLQALNGTYGEDSKDAMQTEAELLLDEITRLRSSTNYNGLTVLGTVVEENCYPSLMSYTPPVATTLSATPTTTEASTEETVPLLMSTMLSSPTPLMTGAGTPITGAFDLSAGEANKKVTIDGVEYTFTNREAVNKSVSYSKDTSTGVLTFLCNNVKIEGDTSVAHNLNIQGDYNYVYGGNYNDTIEISKGRYNYIYGQGGDDNISVTGTSSSDTQYNYLYGGAGNDTLSGGVITFMYGDDGDDTLTGTHYNPIMSGGNGNDVINISGGQDLTYIFLGGAGNDTFNINTTYAINVKGEGDDDTFNISSTLNSATILNGGDGTNNYTLQAGGNINNATLVNIVGGNATSVAFAKNETKNISIDGKNYTVTNGNTAQELVCKINSGTIEFSTSSSQAITITGDENVSHNVNLKSQYMIFYGGNLADTIAVNTNYCTVYGKDGNDTIINNAGANIIYGEAGADTINVSSCDNIVDGGTGDDTISVSNYMNSIMCGEGNDNVVINGNYTGLSIDGGDGTNTISGLRGGELISGFGSLDNATAVGLTAREEKEITIDSKTYKVQNNIAYNNQILYRLDTITNQTVLSGNKLNITADKTIQNNVEVRGYNNYYYGSDLGDTISSLLYVSYIYSGTGNDNIIVENNRFGACTITDAGGDNTFTLNYLADVTTGNGNNTININCNNTGQTITGGTGVDTYYINQPANIKDNGGNNVYFVNTNGATITGGDSNDTFYIAGNNNTVSGSSGDDYFVIDGTGGMIDGGTGTNYYVDNSGGTVTIINATPDPTGGVLSFTSVGETKSFTMDGITYTVKNQTLAGSSPATNTVQYYYNQNTKTITFNGSDVTIIPDSDKAVNMNIRGDNNTVNGSNLNDKIKIESGTNNIVNGLSGDDTLTMETADNALNAGAGNDILILNASTTKNVVSGTGINTITLNADNNTHLDLSNGTNTVRGTSAGNTITLGNNNNDIYLVGAGTTVTGGSGDNAVTLVGANSNVSLQNGNNTIKLQGDNSTAVSGKGNSNINIWGNNGNITTGDGYSTLLLSGDGGKITGGKNITKVTVTGSSNDVDFTSGNADVTVTGNSNDIDYGNGSGNITITGNSNTLDMQNGDNAIKITGDGNTLVSGTGTKSLNINGNTNTVTLSGQTTADMVGDENNLTTGNSADVVSFKGDDNTVHTQDGEDTISFKGDNNKVYSGDANDLVTIKSGDSNLVDGEGGSKNYVYDNAENSDIRNAIRLMIEPFKLRTQVGIYGDENSVINTEISFSTKGLEIDFSTEESIIDNLNDIDELLDSVITQMSNIGAVQNRLKSAQDSSIVQSVNLAASLSTIKDVDIAQETSTLTAQQILQQACASLLVQTNYLQQSMVLQLIKGQM